MLKLENKLIWGIWTYVGLSLEWESLVCCRFGEILYSFHQASIYEGSSLCCFVCHIEISQTITPLAMLLISWKALDE